MRIFRKLEQFTPNQGTSAVAIGNFDGIHLGHKKILEFLRDRSLQYKLESIVLTFHPHPRKVIGDGNIRMIQTLDQKIRSIGDFGIQNIIILDFTPAFAKISSEEFAEHFLARTLLSKEVIVGDNFHFGKKRSGDIQLLKKLSRKHGFKIFSVPGVKIGRELVNSSEIRNFLIEGQIEKANAHLGSPYEIRGSVIRGSSQGRKLGFPTANIHSANEILPSGVFLTQTKMKGKTFPSLTNIGIRPTFGHSEKQVETFIIGLKHDIYDETITISLLDKLRDEIKFPSPEKLKEQIQDDLKSAREKFDFLDI
ncbi:bifunctional riboflavin kinase/FAD synthetase [Acidobacteriota bacterium]